MSGEDVTDAPSRTVVALERIAESLESIDMAFAIMAGLWVPPPEPEAPIDEWDCACSATLSAPRDVPETMCPNCKTVWWSDGLGKWTEKA